jgi:deazaflavin-dependent oxidoreductase (nitroreductase family)
VTSIDALAATEFCYLTTRGRRTGSPHRIEIWFVGHADCAYLLSDSDRADWYRNLLADPSVALEIGGEMRTTTAAPVDADDPANAAVRPAMAAKYQAGYAEDLDRWSRTAWLVRIEWPEADQARSSTTASPWPPLMQSVARPSETPAWRIS